MRIKRKLDIGFGVVVLMLLGVVALSGWSLDQYRYNTAHLESTFLQQRELARLTSEVGQGSIFSFTLPKQEANVSTEELPRPVPGTAGTPKKDVMTDG